MNYHNFIGKTAKIRGQISGHHYGPESTLLRLTNYLGSGYYRAVRLDDGFEGDGTKINISEIDIVENVIGLFDTNKFVKLKKSNEVPDKYGLDCVLEIVDELGKIYLSNGTRSILQLEPGDKVSMAINEEDSTIYLSKDIEGEEVSPEGIIENIEFVRILVHSKNEHLFSLSLSKLTNPDYPDLVFYELTPFKEPVISLQKNKKRKKELEQFIGQGIQDQINVATFAFKPYVQQHFEKHTINKIPDLLVSEPEQQNGEPEAYNDIVNL